MARSWTRLHEHLGMPPGPITFDMVAQAAADRLAESDDLDWKEQLPQPPREGRWNELAKDVAAMANTRGGLIIFGVRDATCELVGIDPDEVKIEQYAQWVRNHVQPYLPDLTFTPLTSPDGATSVLIADVPASGMAPHLVYGTAARDKDQQAAVAPYRDRDHTAWMAEHQLERAYRDRFTRAQRAEDELQTLLTHAQDTVTAQQQESAAWFFAIARPERPLPRTAPRLTRPGASIVVEGARARADQLPGSRTAPGPLAGLQIVTNNPRPGLRRWVLSTMPLAAGREIYAELHHDGTVVLAANLSWQSLRNSLRGDEPVPFGLLVHQDYVGACCRDLGVLASELARYLRVDSGLLLQSTITATLTSAPLVPVVMRHPGFPDIPGDARRPYKIQPVTTTLLPTGEDHALQESTREAFADLMNQFGLEP
ncbi:helix-turn-helix domain-containing protein [Streptomyces sp. NPDC058451]|uniref:AlbA family DNA-binding domain-containing protein n=1 Tax=Streptomyces sp. NPDC058451 TaxID=3346506 RepID=UPI0036562688